MKATTILICGAALLLTGMHSLIGYAQIDDGSNEKPSGDDSTLSATGAQGAINRFDFGFSRIELPLIDQASIEAKFTTTNNQENEGQETAISGRILN